MPRDTKGKPVKMAHMERTKAEKKEREKDYAIADSGPDYPYGLRVNLDHDGLKKVGMEDMPEVGSEVHLQAKAHVVSARSEKREGSEERHLEMQITHLGVHHKPDDMKSEDQSASGSKKPEAGHVTDKGNKGGGDKAKEKGTGKDAYYGRKRS